MGWIPAWSSRLPGRLRLLCSHKTYSCLVRFVVIFASALPARVPMPSFLPARLEIQGMDEPSLQSPAESASSAGDNQPAPEDSAAWRQEVAARLNRYQSRRKPRPPRYPSLRLRFEEDEATRGRPESSVFPAGACLEQALALTSSLSRFQSLGRCTRPRLIPLPTPQQFLTERKFRSRRRLLCPAPATATVTAKIIEFPRLLDAPPARA